jgi:hypothetical protein
MTTDWSTLEPGTIIRHKTQSGRTARVIAFDDGYYIVRSVWPDGRQGAVSEAHPAMWEPVPPEPRYLKVGDAVYGSRRAVAEMVYTESVGWIAVLDGGLVWKQVDFRRGVTNSDGVLVPWPPAPEVQP